MVDLPCRTRPGKLTDASVGWKARDEVIIRRYRHCVGLGFCTRGADGLDADHMTQVISRPVGQPFPDPPAPTTWRWRRLVERGKFGGRDSKLIGRPGSQRGEVSDSRSTLLRPPRLAGECGGNVSNGQQQAGDNVSEVLTGSVEVAT
jgi:hypothetical protein